MQQISHSQHAARKRNSPKVNLIISVVLHVVVLGLAFVWAAKEGMMGKTMQTLTADITKNAKKVEQAKKEDPKALEEKKAEVAKIVSAAKTVTAAAPTATAPPPPPMAVADAPPPVAVAMTFGDEVTGDPIVSYKSQVEIALRGKWSRPTDLADLDFAAEVELRVDSSGKILGYDWKHGSGNERWDGSVRQVLGSVTGFRQPPPSGFPEKFTVRFDVLPAQEEPLMTQAN